MNKFQKFIINHDKDTFEAYYRTHLNLKNTEGYDKLVEVWSVRDQEKQHIAKQSKINYRVLYNKQDIDNLLLEFGGK